jgi:flagellar basal body-associated protein FliL
MLQTIFIIAVILVVPAFFLFTWLMSRHHTRKKAERQNPPANSKNE